MQGAVRGWGSRRGVCALNQGCTLDSEARKKRRNFRAQDCARSLCHCQQAPQLSGIRSIKNVCKWFDEPLCVSFPTYSSSPPLIICDHTPIGTVNSKPVVVEILWISSRYVLIRQGLTGESEEEEERDA